jgi:hypothetical protein
MSSDLRRPDRSSITSRGAILRVVFLAILLFRATTSAVADEDKFNWAGGTMRTLGALGGTVDLRVLNIGTVTSQGDAAMNAPLARSNFAVNGNGVTIGVISDSFNASGLLPAMATQITNGDLPGPGNPNGFLTPVNVVKDDTNGTDEGRAMLEIVHDVAPGATLMFHSAFNNFTDGSVSLNSIANAIDGLRLAGADIIVDDVGLLNQPFFQDGPAAQAVNVAKAAGIAYFSSAGNSGSEAWSGTFNGAPGDHQDFDVNGNEGGDIFLNINVPNNRSVRVVVEWDDAYPSVGAPANAADYDIGLFDFNTGMIVGTSIRNQMSSGLDPWEIVAATNTSGAEKQLGLLIDHFSGSTSKVLKARIFNSGTIADDDDTNDATIHGHTAAEGAVAVAAHQHATLTTVEPFSSRGETQIKFDTSGNPIADVRATPQLTGPDGASTTTAGFSTFFGTSAAAPHVAGASALVLQRADDLGVSLSADDLYNILFSTAIDMETAGFDNLSGFGRLDVNAAVSAVVPEPAGALLIGVGFIALCAGVRLRGGPGKKQLSVSRAPADPRARARSERPGP